MTIRKQLLEELLKENIKDIEIKRYFLKEYYCRRFAGCVARHLNFSLNGG